jgi:hypothetical protein
VVFLKDFLAAMGGHLVESCSYMAKTKSNDFSFFFVWLSKVKETKYQKLDFSAFLHGSLNKILEFNFAIY